MPFRVYIRGCFDEPDDIFQHPARNVLSIIHNIKAGTVRIEKLSGTVVSDFVNIHYRLSRAGVLDYLARQLIARCVPDIDQQTCILHGSIDNSPLHLPVEEYLLPSNSL